MLRQSNNKDIGNSGFTQKNAFFRSLANRREYFNDKTKEAGLLIKRKKDLLLANLARYLCHPFSSPQFFDIQITDICNLNCIMCNSFQSIGHLDYGTLVDLMEQINNFSEERKIIHINGGEPLLYPRFKELSHYARGSHNILSLGTNGLLMDKFLDDIVGYDSLTISIDGLKQANDMVRGEGIFDRITGNIKKLYDFVTKRGVRLNVTFNILITKYNYSELFLLIKYLYEIHPYAGFSLLNIIEDNTNAYIGLDNRLGFIEAPGRLAEEISNIKNFCASKDLRFHYPEGYLNYLISNKKYRGWKCFAGYNRLTVVANGDVWICDTALGNIKKEKLKKIWYSKKARDFRRKVKACKNLCFMDCYAQTFI